MTWFGWAVIVFYSLGCLVRMARAKNEEAAVAELAVTTLMIIGFLFVGTGHI